MCANVDVLCQGRIQILEHNVETLVAWKLAIGTFTAKQMKGVLGPTAKLVCEAYK